MKIHPIHDRVVVKRLEAEAKSAGGIIIPDTAKEKPQKGEIVAVGPGSRNKNGDLLPMEVKRGDVVLFSKYAGTEVKFDDIDHLIIKEDDILCILE